MQQFTVEQTRAIIARTEETLAANVNFKCLACTAGLNIAVGGIIIGLVAAGVAVGPEVAAVVSIATSTGLEAATVVTIINSSLALGSATAGEAIVTGLCQAMGAC